MESDRGGQRGLQPVDGRSRRPCSSWPRRSGARSMAPIGRPFRTTSPTRPSSTTSSCASRTSARRGRCSDFEATTTLDEMLDEVIPWIRGEVGGRPAVSRLLPELYDARFDEREVSAKDAVWREIVALPAALRRPGRAGPRPRPAIAAISSAGSRPPRQWATDIRDMRAALPERRPVRAGVRSRACGRALPNGYFGTVFMSNYLEHLESSDAVIDQLRVVAAAARDPAAGRSSSSRTSGSSGRATGTSSTTRWP